MTEIIEREKRIMEVEGYRVCCFCQKQRPLDVELCDCFEEKDDQKYGRLDNCARRFADALQDYQVAKYREAIIGVAIIQSPGELEDKDFSPQYEADKKIRSEIRHVRMALADFVDEWEKIKSGNSA